MTAATVEPILREAGQFKLIAFDFDGTLADTFGWLGAVINDVADRYRFRRVEEHEAELLRGMDARALMRHLGIPVWKLPLISRHMHALMARDIATIRLFDGVPAMLDALVTDGFRLSVVSSNTEDNVRAVLGKQASLFSNYACGASLFGKARRFRTLIKANGLLPAQVLAIGDEIRDLEAAREAGCAFAAVTWGFTDGRALAAHRPDHLFDGPADIASMLCDRSEKRAVVL